MEFLIYRFSLDLVAFALAIGAATFFLSRWVSRKTGARLGWHTWAAMGAIVLATMALALIAERSEHRQLERTVSGMAPTYADELYRQGHEKMSPTTAADDPAYLAMIESQKRWEKENPEVADIYTFMRTPEDKNVLVVDSETDYDHNGAYEGEREARTAIGEVYEEDEELLARAFAGEAVFTPQPTSDRWGTWVSTYVPMRNANGDVIAVLGVDYDAQRWVAALLSRRGSTLALGGIVGIIFLASQALLATVRSEMKKREALNEQLVAASRRAGMAEIATGVLHNVGNAINSINISAEVITEKLQSGGSTPDEIAQVAKMIDSNAGQLDRFFTADETGKQLPAYFGALAETLKADQDVLHREMQGLIKGIEHVKEIVKAQQEFSTHRAVLAKASPTRVFEEAIAIGKLSRERHGVEVVREFGDVPEMMLDRNQIMQILVNLLANAVHATKQKSYEGGAQPRVIVRLLQNAGVVEWQVEDNGIGIPAENLAKIFRHGFTTKAEGHGFGLHSCANAANAMGGRVAVESAGAGKGARFRLMIPFSVPQVAESSITSSEVSR